MAYCEAGDVMDMLKKDAMNPITSNWYIENPEKRRGILGPPAREAIGDADAGIDGYLMKRYSVPMPPVPAAIREYSEDIVVYSLIPRAEIGEGERENNYLTRYKNAIALLTKMAKGETDTVKEGTGPSKAAVERFRVSSSSRLFPRVAMKRL